MAAAKHSLDLLFHALSDATRRHVVHRLSRSPATVSELARPFPLSLPSFMQHLRMLECSGLVRSRKVGRVRTYRLVPKRLRVAEDWIAQQRAIWEKRFGALDSDVSKTSQDGIDSAA